MLEEPFQRRRVLFFGVQRDERDQEGGRVSKQDVLLRGIEIPDGYEPTGEYRRAINEPYTHGSGIGLGATTAFPVIILRRKEPDAVKVARLAMPLLKSVGINTVLLSKAQRESVEAVELCDRIIADFERGAK
jgi:hypothetical protein